MASEPLVLRALAWDHQRGFGAAKSVAEAYAKTRDDVRVVWDNRPKMMFAYMPLEDMFTTYDLVLFDHPTVGRTVDSLPPMACLDDLIEAEWLSSLRANSIGPTYESYTLHGRQWAARWTPQRSSLFRVLTLSRKTSPSRRPGATSRRSYANWSAWMCAWVCP